MEGHGGGGGVVVVGRAEIDTRAPFRSVKEAVMLFGERVLAGEVYAHKLNQMKSAAASKSEVGVLIQPPSRVITLAAAELEGTKQSLEKAREESLMMASNMIICALQEELHKTKKELQELKAREAEKTTTAAIEEHCEMIKEIKSMEEISTDQRIIEQDQTPTGRRHEPPDVVDQKRRYVKFANPPATKLAQVTSTSSLQAPSDHNPATPAKKKKKKKKKKPLIPVLLGEIFSRKKGARP